MKASVNSDRVANMFKSLAMRHAVPRVFMIFILNVGVLASLAFSQEEPVTVEGDVTIVETEIGLDQIVVQRKREGPDRKVSAKAGPAAARDKLLILGDAGPSLTPDKIVDLDRMLKKAIEVNQQLEADKQGLDQQLKNLRGQRTIEVNRIKSLGTERDSYKGMFEQAQKSMLKLQEQISDLETRIAEKDRQMNLLLAQPPVTDVPEGGEESLVEISDRELAELRQTIATLRRQLLDKEQAIARMSEEQQSGAQAELTALSGQITRLEEQLKEKDADYQDKIAALQTDKEAAEEKAQALGGELKDLQEQLNRKNKELAQLPEGQQKQMVGPSSQSPVRTKVSSLAPSAQPEASSAAGPALNKPQKITPGQLSAIMPEAAAPAPEVSFVPDALTDEDAAFQDRVRSQNVIAMLDQMSKRNEGLRADEGRVHYNMGNIFFHQGDYERARDEFRMAVQLMPYDANAHFNLAFVSWEYLEDFKTALEHFQQYLWLNPEAEDANLVKEKIIAAQLEVMGSIDSKLEQEVRDERMHRWKYTDVTNGRVGEYGK